MGDLQETLRGVVEQLLGPKGLAVPALRWGNVTAIEGQASDTVTVTIGASTEAVAGVRFLANVFRPQVDDVVVLAEVGPDLFVLGKLFPEAGSLPTIGYAEKTADQTNISDADITGLSVPVNVILGRRYKVTAFCPQLYGGTIALDTFGVRIQESTTVRAAGIVDTSATTGFGGTVTATYIFVAAATAVQTFKVRLVRTSGSGTISWGASATEPSFILVEDVGV